MRILVPVLAVSLVAGCASCQRVAEPTPVAFEQRDAIPAPSPSASTSTAIPAPAVKCPVDPEPHKAKMFDHGTAAFVTPDGVRHAFDVEIARSEDAHARGLMFRTELAENAGMVFDFATPHHASFWMHNTCIPLDMVFVSESKVVIGVITAPPLNDTSRAVPGFSKWVVELAAGVAKKRGIAIGTTFQPPT